MNKPRKTNVKLVVAPFAIDPTSIAILNAKVQAVRGVQGMYALTLEEAKGLLAKASTIVSYVGHPSSVQYVKNVLGITVEQTRGMYAPKVGSIALCLASKRRLDENVTLSVEEMVDLFEIDLLVQLPDQPRPNLS